MWVQDFPSVIAMRKCCVFLRKGYPVVEYALIFNPRLPSPLVAISFVEDWFTP